MNESEESVSEWIADLKAGNDNAMSPLWDRYFERLCEYSRKKLGSARKTVVDSGDLAASSLHALWQGARDGRFRQLENRSDLWQILVVIASRKAANVHRQQASRREQDDRAGMEEKSSAAALTELLTVSPDQSMIEQLPLSCEELLRALDDKHREVALMRMAGHSNQEIADKRDCSVKSVERYMNFIRTVWGGILDD